MTSLFQEHLNRFIADFEATANRQRPDEELSVKLVRSALSKRPKEETTAYAERCQRVFNAYSYVAKNAPALRNIQSIIHTDDGPEVDEKLLTTLYLFFIATDFYLKTDPSLDLFIAALVKDDQNKK